MLHFQWNTINLYCLQVRPVAPYCGGHGTALPPPLLQDRHVRPRHRQQVRQAVQTRGVPSIFLREEEWGDFVGGGCIKCSDRSMEVYLTGIFMTLCRRPSEDVTLQFAKIIKGYLWMIGRSLSCASLFSFEKGERRSLCKKKISLYLLHKKKIDPIFWFVEVGGRLIITLLGNVANNF